MLKVLFLPLTLTLKFFHWLLKFTFKVLIKWSIFIVKNVWKLLFKSSKARILREVNEDVQFNGSSCTEIILGDKRQKKIYMKTSTFDPKGSITAKARTLIGKAVEMKTWKEEIWSDEYFNDLNEVPFRKKYVNFRNFFITFAVLRISG